jgi:hypothetical protein
LDDDLQRLEEALQHLHAVRPREADPASFGHLTVAINETKQVIANIKALGQPNPIRSTL